AASFDAKVYQDPLERLKLLDTIQQLREENDVLKRELASARQRLGAEGSLARGGAGLDASATIDYPQPAAARAEPARSEPPRAAAARVDPPRAEPAAAPRAYTIRPGDTLYKISKQVYGDASR